MLSLLAVDLVAQDTEVTQPTEADRSWYIFLPLTSHFDSFQSADIGVQTTKNNHSMGLEIGYVYQADRFNSSLLFYDENKLSSRFSEGLHVAFNYRLEVPSEQFSNIKSSMYLEIMPFLYAVNSNVNLIAGYGCNDPWMRCTYYQLFETTINRVVSGVNFSLVRFFEWDRWNITAAGGFGLRNNSFSYEAPNQKEIDQVYTEFGDDQQFSNEFFPTFRISMMVGYKIK